jgi:hypothetical protein
MLRISLVLFPRRAYACAELERLRLGAQTIPGVRGIYPPQSTHVLSLAPRVQNWHHFNMKLILLLALLLGKGAYLPFSRRRQLHSSAGRS